MKGITVPVWVNTLPRLKCGEPWYEIGVDDPHRRRARYPEPADARTLGPDVALDIMVGRRHDLALHKDHLTGLTRLLLDAADTIGHAGNCPLRPLLPLRRDRERPPAVGGRRPGTPERHSRPETSPVRGNSAACGFGRCGYAG
ncbi:hypothetical protein ACFYO5_24465 [Streptomyces sp. NPDC006259]|uniref:hypothetical protein n=1 Tax=Streptomyces sp. NPDC006259 TaxID=3364740 RepID=UPI0036AE232E